MRHLCLADNRDARPASLINGVAVVVFLSVFIVVCFCFLLFCVVFFCCGLFSSTAALAKWKLLRESHGVQPQPLMENCACSSHHTTALFKNAGSGWWGSPCGSFRWKLLHKSCHAVQIQVAKNVLHYQSFHQPEWMPEVGVQCTYLQQMLHCHAAGLTGAQFYPPPAKAGWGWGDHLRPLKGIRWWTFPGWRSTLFSMSSYPPILWIHLFTLRWSVILPPAVLPTWTTIYFTGNSYMGGRWHSHPH